MHKKSGKNIRYCKNNQPVILKKKGDFAMAVCNTNLIKFSTGKGRKVQRQFTGGDITSDCGVMILR